MYRRGFKHWLGRRELPQPLPQDKLLRYYNFLSHSKLPGVQHSAGERIILHHLRLGMALVARFVDRNPFKVEDLVSEMLEALVDGVEMIKNGALDHHVGDPGITGYLSQTMYGRMHKLVTRDKFAKAIYTVGHKELGNEEGVKRKGNRYFVLTKRISVRSGEGHMDLLEVIDKCMTTDREREVISLRVEGFDDAEIGKMLQPNLTKARVHQIRMAVRRRIEEQLI